MRLEHNGSIEQNNQQEDLSHLGLELKKLQELVRNVEFSLEQLESKIDGINSGEVVDPMTQLLDYLSLHSKEIMEEVENKEAGFEQELDKITETLSRMQNNVNPDIQNILNKIYTQKANLGRKESAKIVEDLSKEMYAGSPQIFKKILDYIYTRANISI